MVGATLLLLSLSTSPAGWYRGSDGRDVLVTYGAGDGLRIADFERRTWEHLERGADGTYVWKRPKASLAVRFVGAEFRAASRDGAVLYRATRKPNYGYSVREVSFESEGARLFATVLMPASGKAKAAVTMIHGSGESHRDNMWYQYQADCLAKRGVAVLLPDKRGCGKSKGDWRTVGFDVLARDATAGLQVLCRQPGVSKRRAGLVGLSQGGWVAPLAASQSRLVRFVVSVSAAAVTPGKQVRHEVRNSLVAARLPASLVEESLRLQDAAEAFIRGGSWEAFDAKRQAAATSPISKFAAEFPAKPDAWVWSWWRRVIDFDPAAVIASIGRPCLVVYGAKDETDNVPVAESVARLKELPAYGRSLTVKVFPQSGHAMGDPATGWIAADYLKYVADWILAHRG
jgi:pimeloyl-ACP methyl ester carboxylesterase